MDLTAFWLSDERVLQHTMLRCKVFPDERKTGENIHHEIQSIFTEFGLKSGDTPITTDCGANIICALNSETRFPCMAHRLNTVLTDAVKVVESDEESFLLFNQAVRDLIAYVHRSDLSQDKLPVTLKNTAAPDHESLSFSSTMRLLNPTKSCVKC